jgi:hypothetical protein
MPAGEHAARPPSGAYAYLGLGHPAGLLGERAGEAGEHPSTGGEPALLIAVEDDQPLSARPERSQDQADTEHDCADGGERGDQGRVAFRLHAR